MKKVQGHLLLQCLSVGLVGLIAYIFLGPFVWILYQAGWYVDEIG